MGNLGPEPRSPVALSDPDASGLPIAVLSREVYDRTSRAMAASICGTISNFLGADGAATGRDWKGDTISFRHSFAVHERGGVRPRNQQRRPHEFQGQPAAGPEPEFGKAAADGQMGYIMKRYFWSNGYAWGTFDIKPKV